VVLSPFSFFSLLLSPPPRGPHSFSSEDAEDTIEDSENSGSRTSPFFLSRRRLLDMFFFRSGRPEVRKIRSPLLFPFPLPNPEPFASFPFAAAKGRRDCREPFCSFFFLSFWTQARDPEAPPSGH